MPSARAFLLAAARTLKWRLAGALVIAIALACTEGAGLLLLLPLLQSIGLEMEPASGWIAGSMPQVCKPKVS